ncbi:MAG TPA: ABC transporter ATP-binding protein [Acidobacteriota bacterium]|nr:ABC transporter ATP-binding protein [Acidobacteriota bacterium]
MEEDIQIREYDSKLMKRLLIYLRPYRGRIIIAIVLMLCTAGLQILAPYLVKVAIDKYISKRDLQGLTMISLVYLVLLVAQMMIEYFQVFLLQMTGQHVMYDMRMQIFSHLQKLELNFFHKNPVGRLMTRVTNDVDVLNELFTSGVVSILGDILTLVGIMAAMLVINFRLAIVTLSVVPLLFLATTLFRKKARAAYSETRYWLARINAFLQEAISGMSIIQLFSKEDKMFAKFDDINHKYFGATKKSVMAYAVLYPVVEMIEALAIALLVWYGGNRAIAGFVTFGSLVAFIQYTQRFFRPIADLSEKYNILQSAMASSEKIFNLLDTNEMIAPANGAPLDGKLNEVEFRNVSYRYPGGEPVLRNVSFRIAPGEKIAVVGPTGAGKTTITSLLLRFYDGYEGQILVNGRDLRTIPEEQIRRDFAVVFQDAFLFSRTVRENIIFDRPEISDARVQAVATELLADPFIRELPKGYDEMLSERGSNLSFGQRQLLTFVRALAANPGLIVLDEATSSVDIETEYVIRRALKRLMEGRTAILIAHRLSTIQNVDRILVLFEGEIREEGTHQELLDREGLYSKLYQLQYKEQAV